MSACDLPSRHVHITGERAVLCRSPEAQHGGLQILMATGIFHSDPREPVTGEHESGPSAASHNGGRVPGPGVWPVRRR